MSFSSFTNAIRRLAADPGFRSTCFAFGLTRAIVIGILLLTTSIQREPDGPAYGGNIKSVRVEVDGRGFRQRLVRAAEVADGLWYLNIARNGHEQEPFNADRQHTWAFFPLYPLLIKLAASVTREFPLTASLLSNIFFFAALVMLHKTASLWGSNDGDAERIVFYLAAFPTSYFFSLPFTESLFLLLTVSSFFLAKRDRWWSAGIVGALAAATRLAGIFLLPALLILYWQGHRKDGLRAKLLGLCVIPAGLIAYMLYLRSITGNAFAFVDIQSAWGHRPNFFLRPLFDYLTSPLTLGAGWDFRLLNFAAVVLAFICCGVLLKRREWALAVFALLSVIVPLSATVLLQSLARYVMVIFPVFMVMGTWGRTPRRDQAIRAVLITLMALMTALFGLRVGLALA
ncbi:MAG: hypothetical protein QOD75_3725 [Blastocatellia bacterium]|jgi:hypothetical protein|nr:hypothetical protein [Blastocatellia bacterium]